jgi:hypothetical protein
VAERLTAELLFRRFFAPLYPGGSGADLARIRATDENPAKNPHVDARLEAAAEVFAQLAPAALEAPDLVLDFSDASVHRLSAKLGRARRDAWIEQKVEGTPLLVQMVTHGALYLGACVVRGHGGAWLVRNPTWESRVRLESRAGVGELAPFMWWLKALGDEEIDDPRLADRYRRHVELATFDAEALPRIAPPDRRLPRLTKVRYDTLHKHLKAHLPELRSVGDHFPSPERLDEMGFAWLDFALVGDGRMLLMHGPGREGVHLFWLDAGGFVQSAYYAADKFPAHVLKIDGEKIAMVVPVAGEMRVHEMLWWGV